MTIYHSISYYQTLVCLVHSCKNTDDKKVILISGSIEKSLDVKWLKKFFDEVVFIDIRVGFVPVDTETTIIDEDILQEYFDGIFKSIHVEIDDDTKFYAGGCHYNFGVYLSVKQFPFYYIEEACGLLSNPDHVRNIDRNNRKEIDLVDGLGLYDATAQNIVGIICNANEQFENYENPKMVHFDTSKELLSLDEESIKGIMRVYGDVEKKSIPSNSVVVLSQHYANLNMMTYDEQAELYGLFFDYFLEGKHILVKRHPADNMAYSAMFDNVDVIKERFLSEFIPVVMEPLPTMIATISSTGIKPLRSVSESCLELDFDFEKRPEVLHRTYMALKLIADLALNFDVFYYRINKSMMKNLCEYSDPMLRDLNLVEVSSLDEVNENSILIVDNLPDEAYKERNIEEIADYFVNECSAKAIIFINSDSKYIFHKSLDGARWENIVPININISYNAPFEGAGLHKYCKNEQFYVYSKDKEVLRMASEFKNSKELKHSKLVINTEGYDSEAKLKIAILQGMLEASENRLAYYMNNESKQEDA